MTSTRLSGFRLRPNGDGGQRVVRAWRDPQVIAATVCALAGFGVFEWFGNGTRGYIPTASLFYWWGFQWFNAGSETEHGPLILGLSAWLFWRNLKNAGWGLRRAERRADGPAQAPLPAARPTAPSALRPPQGLIAAAAMIAGLALHALGYGAQQARLSIVALLVFAWGVLALAGGRRWGRAAAFPLAFLVFAIPFNALDSVGFYLRLWVIDATHLLAHVAGIEVVRNGTQLFSPGGGYQYDVAAACSGVRSLMALMALSLLVGYLQFRSWWRRLLVFLLCFPLTYLGNVLRIAAIVFAGEWLGHQAGLVVHEWAGFLVFVIVLGGVLLAVRLWQRCVPETCHTLYDKIPAPPTAERLSVGADACHTMYDKSAGGAEGEAGAGPAVTSHTLYDKGVGWRGALGAAGVVVLVAVVVAGGTRRFDRIATAPEAGVRLAEDGANPAGLPAFVATDWIGQRIEVSDVERAILPPDTGYSRRNYVSTHDPRERVLVSIVLSGRDRTSIHRPELCVVGEGWSIAARSNHRFRHPMGGEVPATLLHLRHEGREADGRRGGRSAVFAYWFVGRDTVVATHLERLWRTARERVWHARADRWAYVVAQTVQLPGEDEAAALARLQTVLDGTLPAFQPPLSAAP